MTAFEQLKKKLHEIFQLDKRELDFGIYRIMNLKADEIASFIDNDLLPQVKGELETYTANDNKEIKEELNKVIENAKNLGIDPNASPKVKELQAKLSQVFDAEKTEIEIYSELYNFFKRYYSEGDFLSLRRYKEGVYALPYEGEEVKLHWANADQYYIKSSETLTNYTFKVGESKIRFEVVDATTEQNNNKAKEERRFKLVENNPVRQENGEYIISFSYLPDSTKTKQEELNRQIEQALFQDSVLSPCITALRAEKVTGKTKNSLLYKHLTDFTAKNTFDYFIHKNLDKFLRRELDFYIKNEMMHLDDIESENAPRVEQYLAKIKVFRKIAGKIITFLASLEDFQKKLWLKKKFVLESNYCITLDRIPEELYEEITQNDAQREEWVKLFAINEIEQDTTRVGYSVPLTTQFLKENPFLVLDTAFFNTDFKYKLLSKIDDLDKTCDGLLIHSENFQALNLLQEKYFEKIGCIYIDPPYNAKSSEIVYKNDYKNSSWNSFINDRVRLSYNLLNEESIFQFAIDDYEVHNSIFILNNIFGDENHLGNITVVHNPRGRNDDKFYGTAHEYMLSYSKNSEISEIGFFPLTDDDRATYKQNDGLSNFSIVPFIRTGNNSKRFERPNLFYPIYVNKYTNELSLSESNDCIELLPIVSGEERTWRWGKDTFEEKQQTEILCKKDNTGYNGYKLYKKRRDEGVGKKAKTVWFDSKYDASSHGIMYLRKMFSFDLFSYPKSIWTVHDALQISMKPSEIVLDYFAGSGTTGHAIINLNREDGGNRKYIMAEMGNYFDLITKPRIEKVIYSEDWKNGKPVSRKGSSHCFKYIRLESYEDALDNLSFNRTDTQEQLFTENKPVQEEYVLKYMMDLETKGSLLTVKDFNHPFDYSLNITRNGETKRVSVDLVETFNYLIGLNVQYIEHSRGVIAVEGITRTGEKTLVLWRDTSNTTSDALNEWFEKRSYSTKDKEFDVIYVNGDNNLENIRKENETWKVRLTEAEFLKRMFDVQEA